jgi:hypothetical protein
MLTSKMVIVASRPGGDLSHVGHADFGTYGRAPNVLNSTLRIKESERYIAASTISQRPFALSDLKEEAVANVLYRTPTD